MSDKAEAMFQEALQLQRSQIDQADDALLQALRLRLEAVETIGRLKRQHGQPVLDASREAELFAHYKNRATQLGLNPELVEKIWQVIINYSRQQQTEATA